MKQMVTECISAFLLTFLFSIIIYFLIDEGFWVPAENKPILYGLSLISSIMLVNLIVNVTRR